MFAHICLHYKFDKYREYAHASVRRLVDYMSPTHVVLGGFVHTTPLLLYISSEAVLTPYRYLVSTIRTTMYHDAVVVSGPVTR